MFCSHGRCIPYTTETFSSNINPCDAFYRPGNDYIYLPFGRGRNSLRHVNYHAAELSLVTDSLRPVCRYHDCGHSAAREVTVQTVSHGAEREVRQVINVISV